MRYLTKSQSGYENAGNIFGVFLPITFIAGLYGMNFKFMPELQHPYGYFATVGVMVLIVIITFIYFRRKNGKQKDIVVMSFFDNELLIVIHHILMHCFI